MNPGRMGGLRGAIRAEVASVVPHDRFEAEQKASVLNWIDSGAELARRRPPATPPRHLVSYCVLTDGERVVLVDHLKSGLWLPPGGHVDAGEHPRDCAHREAAEELGFHGSLRFESALFLSESVTVGSTAGHRDVALWYVFDAPLDTTLSWDGSEFRRATWFDLARAPVAKSDPQLGRFIDKLRTRLVMS
ncbi:MAG: NUDIX domain-containing protein [Pseudomonadota bacterium]